MIIDLMILYSIISSVFFNIVKIVILQHICIYNKIYIWNIFLYSWTTYV